MNRYLLNLKKEIGTQIRLLKPNTITEAQTHPIETEMLLKESQPVPRSNGNTNGIRTPNHSVPLADRVKMICYKCGKTGHFANQCHVKQGFQLGLNVKRPPQPVRMVQKENTDALQMTPEEVQEQIEYEESAEYQPYADDSGPHEREEEQKNTDYWSTQEHQ